MVLNERSLLFFDAEESFRNKLEAFDYAGKQIEIVDEVDHFLKIRLSTEEKQTFYVPSYCVSEHTGYPYDIKVGAIYRVMPLSLINDSIAGKSIIVNSITDGIAELFNFIRDFEIITHRVSTKFLIPEYYNNIFSEKIYTGFSTSNNIRISTEEREQKFFKNIDKIFSIFFEGNTKSVIDVSTGKPSFPNYILDTEKEYMFANELLSHDEECHGVAVHRDENRCAECGDHFSDDSFCFDCERCHDHCVCDLNYCDRGDHHYHTDNVSYCEGCENCVDHCSCENNNEDE
jgi:hypothetical protein